MLEALQKIWVWVASFWDRIPSDQRDRIIKFIVESFDALLRSYFQSNKGEAAA
jgi:hypothetical protein